MHESYDRRASNRTRAQLQAARSAGAWMPWAAALLAVVAWIGVAAWLLVNVGPEKLFALPPLTLATGLASILVPGLALICAGIMARESRRSTEANALVLASARLLLEPADHARDEIASIAEAVARETQSVNKALSDTRSRMDALKAEIETSVVGALKAAEIVRKDSEVLVSKMTAERQSLMQLSESLKNQAENLSKAIPRHAQMMSEAARAAQDEVRKADESLDQRLRGVDEVARRLAERIDALDTMGAESRKRAQNLAGALSRMDEQLVQSTRMVDAAVRAGELATAASKGTADTLRDAMSDALSAALKASETISAQSATASQEAIAAMNRLREAGLQAEAVAKSAMLTARSQADEVEKRIGTISEGLTRAAARPVPAIDNGPDRARDRAERAVLLANTTRDETPPPPEPSPLDDLVLDASAIVRQEPSRAHKPTASADFFTAKRDPAPAPPVDPLLDLPRVGSGRANGVNGAGAPPHPAAPPPPTPSPVEDKPGSRILGLSWRDLLTGVEEATPAPREQTVSTMMERLDRAGIRLNHVVKASDLRRIASASHQGQRQRRRMIRDVAPGEIQRVVRLLDADSDLQQTAKSFVAAEEPEALRQLAGAERSREDAAPRLSAYLLLDAALGAVI